MEGIDYHDGERSKAEFDVEEMKIVWAGSREVFEVSDRMGRLVASDEVNFLFSLLAIWVCLVVLKLWGNWDFLVLDLGALLFFHVCLFAEK